MKVKEFLLLMLCISVSSSLFALKKVSPFRSQRAAAQRIIENRPNSKSSLRYFTTTPDRSCIIQSRITTPRSSQTLIPKREFSISQASSNLWKKARWNFMSQEDKKAELFSALASNIQYNNYDNYLSSLINLFKSENLLNEKYEKSTSLGTQVVTPLEFALELSSTSNVSYQKALINALIENGAQLHGTKELDLAFKYYNLGALEVLLNYISSDSLHSFYEKVKNYISAQEKELKNAQTERYKKLLEKRIRKLRRIEQIMENKTSYFPFEKESELR